MGKPAQDDTSTLNRRLVNVRQKAVDDIPPKGWQAAGSERTPRDASRPSRDQRTRGIVTGNRGG